MENFSKIFNGDECLMNIDIHAGKRVLYKYGNSNWIIGNIVEGPAKVSISGVFVPIKPKDAGGTVDIEINQIFTDAIKLEDWMKDNLVKKEDYVKIIQKEGFEKNLENAWFSDGEYYYYPVSKFSEGWIMRQPFNYVIRGD